MFQGILGKHNSLWTLYNSRRATFGAREALPQQSTLISRQNFIATSFFFFVMCYNLCRFLISHKHLCLALVVQICNQKDTEITERSDVWPVSCGCLSFSPSLSQEEGEGREWRLNDGRRGKKRYRISLKEPWCARFFLYLSAKMPVFLSETESLWPQIGYLARQHC